MDFSPAEDTIRAMSGMQKNVTYSVGCWDLNVRFVKQLDVLWIVMHGALHFKGLADGTLTLWIETPEERLGIESNGN